MGLCQTAVSFLVNPLTYLIMGGGLLGLGALYAYSSYTFLPSLLLLSRLSSGVNFIWNRVKEAWKYGFFRYLAVYTTFYETINTALNQGFKPEVGSVFLNEFWNKMILSVRNIVDGLSTLSKWVGSSNKVCTLAGNTDLLVEGFILLWTGVAAYIFIIWLWDKSFYSWRHKRMEQQQLFLVIVTVTAVSVAAHQTSLLVQGLFEGKELLQGVAQVTGFDVNPGVVNGSEALNSSTSK